MMPFENFERTREIYRQWLLERANGRLLRPGAIPDRREFQCLEQRFHDEERFAVQNASRRRARRPLGNRGTLHLRGHIR